MDTCKRLLFWIDAEIKQLEQLADQSYLSHDEEQMAIARLMELHRFLVDLRATYAQELEQLKQKQASF